MSSVDGRVCSRVATICAKDETVMSKATSTVTKNTERATTAILMVAETAATEGATRPITNGRNMERIGRPRRGPDILHDFHPGNPFRPRLLPLPRRTLKH